MKTANRNRCIMNENRQYEYLIEFDYYANIHHYTCLQKKSYLFNLAPNNRFHPCCAPLTTHCWKVSTWATRKNALAWLGVSRIICNHGILCSASTVFWWKWRLALSSSVRLPTTLSAESLFRYVIFLRMIFDFSRPLSRGAARLISWTHNHQFMWTWHLNCIHKTQ